MTNKERYQRAFSTLHASDDFVLEEKKMKETKVIRFPKLLAACAVLILVLGLATAAYAADVGGIRRTVQLIIEISKFVIHKALPCYFPATAASIAAFSASIPKPFSALVRITSRQP